MRSLDSTILAAIFLAGCSNATPKNTPSPTAEASQAVAVASVESERLDTTLSLPSQITRYEAVDVYPKFTSFLDEIAWIAARAFVPAN